MQAGDAGLSPAASEAARALYRALRWSGLAQLAPSLAHDADTPEPGALADDAGEASVSQEGDGALGAAGDGYVTPASYAAPWYGLARYLFGHGVLIRRLVHDERPAARQQLLAIGQVLALARSYASRPAAVDMLADGAAGSPNTAVRAFLGYVRRLVSMDDGGVRTLPGGDGVNAVRILTIHASKGLEFPVVYVPNLAQGRFPGKERAASPAPWESGPSSAASGYLSPAAHGRNRGMPSSGGDSEQEDDCLFFVAITRARQELVLSRARRYGNDGPRPSRFFDLLRPFFAKHLPSIVQWERRPEPPPPLPDVPASPASPAVPDRASLAESEADSTAELNRLSVPLPGATVSVSEDGGPPLAALLQEVAGNAGHAISPVTAGRLVASLRDQAARAASPATETDMERYLACPRHFAYDAVARAVPDGDSPIPVYDGMAMPVIETLARLGAQATSRDRRRFAELAGGIQGLLAGTFPARPQQWRVCATCPFWITCPA